MPERLLQHPRTTKNNFGKLRFFPDFVSNLPGMMNDRLSYGLRQLSRDRIKRFTVAFKMPQELHFLPLYENILFPKLIDFHNTISSANRFVHPATFMLLDPLFSKQIPSSSGASVPIETYGIHEVKHFISLQNTFSDKLHQGYLLFDLYWEKVKKEKYKALMIGGRINFQGTLETPLAEIALAPNYPSNVDFDMLNLPLSYLKGLNKFLYKLGIFLAHREKAKGQGLAWFEKPLNLDEAVNGLYPRWKKERSNEINTEVYPY